jgi:hypothetical protein
MNNLQERILSGYNKTVELLNSYTDINKADRDVFEDYLGDINSTILSGDYFIKSNAINVINAIGESHRFCSDDYNFNTVTICSLILDLITAIKDPTENNVSELELSLHFYVKDPKDE